jgi:hypothetical protein
LIYSTFFVPHYGHIAGDYSSTYACLGQHVIIMGISGIVLRHFAPRHLAHISSPEPAAAAVPSNHNGWTAIIESQSSAI